MTEATGEWSQARGGKRRRRKRSSKRVQKKARTIPQNQSPPEEMAETPKKPRRRKGKKMVRIYLDGCWDCMHSGHFNAMRQARALGDYLVVGVHSNEEIALNKREPIMTDEERMAMVRQCKWADQVIFDVPYSPTLELLDRADIRADYVAHGDDMPVDASGNYAFADVQSRFKVFKRTPGVSTTSIITRLLLATAHQRQIDVISTTIQRRASRGELDAISAEVDVMMDPRSPKRIPSEETKSQEMMDDMDILNLSHFLSTSSRLSMFSNRVEPKSTDKVIYIDGDFDLFHAGHVALLREAKKAGTYVYVGLYDDAVVRTLRGSMHWPMMCLQERALCLLASKYVDDVIIGAPYQVTSDLITALNVSLVMNCDALQIDSIERKKWNQYGVPKKMGIYTHIRIANLLTTQAIVDRMITSHQRIKKENEGRVQKEAKYLESRKFVEEK